MNSFYNIGYAWDIYFYAHFALHNKHSKLENKNKLKLGNEKPVKTQILLMCPYLSHDRKIDVTVRSVTMNYETF